MKIKTSQILAVALFIIAPRTAFADELKFDVNLASLTAHNTSANPNYNQTNFPRNFGTKSFVTKTETIDVDPARMDLSLHAVTPGHVSGTDVHTLIPSRPDLRWFAHLMGWWGTGKPFDIGVDVNTDSYARALVTDLMNRGFNGVILCWNSPGSHDDQVLRKIQAHLKTLPPGRFTFIVLIDQGLVDKLPTTEAQKKKLEEAVNYCKANFFNDPNYELEDGKPILMFYGVRAYFGKVAGSAGGAAAALKEVKDATGGNMVWADVLPSFLNEAWEDQSYDWHNAHQNKLSATDPYNFEGIKHFYDSIKGSGKKAMGAMSAGYNGTLSKLDGSWALGGYLPQDYGKCLIERARYINSIIPANVTRMQWATWNDWAEGTAVEPGIENDITVSGTIEGTTLSWTVTGGTGDESTIDHYDVYATEDGVNAALLKSVPVGTRSLDLASITGFRTGNAYKIMVVAVGKPCIRNHGSDKIAYSVK